MSTWMRKWTEKDCPEIEYPPAQVLIDREELEQLLDRLKATEEDRSNFLVEMGKLCAQCDALRAKIEAMERQEIGFRERCTPSSPTGYSNRFPLYALPGAKGE